jgi:hypothetical protein
MTPAFDEDVGAHRVTPPSKAGARRESFMKLSEGAGRLLLAGALATPVLVAGCGGGGGHPSSSSTPTPTVAVGASAGGRTITADESEYRIVLSAWSVKPGTYRVVAVNKGTIMHALEINGPGVAGRHTGSISPDNSSSLTVKLVSGVLVVAEPFPVAGRLVIHQLDLRQPLDALVAVHLGIHDTRRRAVRARERLTVRVEREHHVVQADLLERGRVVEGHLEGARACLEGESKIWFRSWPPDSACFPTRHGCTTG